VFKGAFKELQIEQMGDSMKLFTNEPQSLIQTIGDSQGELIKSVRGDQSGRVGLQGNARDRLMGTITPTFRKSDYGAEGVKGMHGEQFHTDNDKQMEKINSEVEEIDSTHDADEEENVAVKVGKKIRTDGYQLSTPIKETDAGNMKPMRKSYTQDELFLKAMGELAPDETATKGGPGSGEVGHHTERHGPGYGKDHPVGKKVAEVRHAERGGSDDGYEYNSYKTHSGKITEYRPEQEGVNRPSNTIKEMKQKNPSSGQSSVGVDVREGNTKGAIAGHKETLAQLKNQKKPNLPKSMCKSHLDDLCDLIKGHHEDGDETEGQEHEPLIQTVKEKPVKNLAKLHENSPGVVEKRKPMPLQKAIPFLAQAGPGGYRFDFGPMTGNPLADNATMLLNRHADPVQAQIASQQSSQIDKALESWVTKGEIGHTGSEFGQPDAGWKDQMNKPMDQQVEEAYKSGALIGKGPSSINKFNEVQGVVNGEVVKASSPTDAAVLEMYKAEMASMNEPGAIVADARFGGSQSVTVDAKTGEAV